MLKASIAKVKELCQTGRLQPKKFRVLVAWLSLIPLVYFSHPSENSFRIGIVFLVVGELIRIWAIGMLEKKGRILTTAGPYTFIRNPLYVGNFIIGIGCIAIFGNVIGIFIFAPIFFLIYQSTIRKEEAELLKTFGEDYQHYCAHVRRFIPHFKRYKNNNKISFSVRRLIYHREYDALLGIACFVCAVYIHEEWLTEGDFSFRVIWAIGLLIFFGCMHVVLKKIRSGAFFGERAKENS